MATVAAALPRGLSEEEAAARAARGERNVLPPATGRTYFAIVRENVLTFINVAILILGVALAFLGQPSDALVSIGVVSVNVLVGVAQEIRAKIVLDRIALLVRPTARVVREGVERELAASELVVGDVVRLTAGDQILADATIVGGGPVEMDESLLTGESAPVTKRIGDPLLSGTFCVSGAATVETRLVGESSIANRLTSGARAFRRVATPLQRRVDTIIRAVLLVAISFAVVLVGAAFVESGGMVEGLKMAMVIAGLVPNGLLLAASAAYAMSAVRVARRGVLVQQANAIDSLSHIDVLCMDKTGTLTTGHPQVARLDALEGAPDELRSLVGRFAASASVPDRTLQAIRASCPGDGEPSLDEVPFSAARRWSAVELATDGALVLGAPDTLLPNVAGPTGSLVDTVEARTTDGLRVLLFARSEGFTPTDPGRLHVVGLICLAEEMRPDSRETIARFASAGIAVKLISGDHPNTVRAVARASGLDDRQALTGDDVASLDDADLLRIVEQTTLFARTTPHEKERLLRALRANGHYAAMVGDGINDVLALKAANLGVALRGGAASARAVADMLLLHDEIGALVPAAEEGRRILRGMRDILRIFLTRVLYAALVIAAVAAIDGGFPFTPKQNALLTLLTVGIPSLALAAWAPAETIDHDDLGARLARMVIPAGWSIAVLGFLTYVVLSVQGADAGGARSALTTMCVVCGLLFLVFIADDTGGPSRPTRRDQQRALLALVLLFAYLVILAVPATAALFDLVTPSGTQLAATVAVAVVWLVVLRALLRARAFEAALGLVQRA